MPARTKQLPIAVAGMHRSGTSMVTHALKLVDVYLGNEEDLFAPSDENPDGYWEHTRFVGLNDEILARLGGGWERPPDVPARFDDDDRLQGVDVEAKKLVREFRGRDHWAWKDPRNSLTIGLWRELVPDLGVVVCLRNPLEVILSLRRRGMFSYGVALELWETYYRRVLEAVPEDRRFVTDYESYFSRPRAELRRLFAFAGVTASRSRLERAAASINGGLRHSVFTLRDLLDADVAPEIVELHLALRREAGLEDRQPARAPAENGTRSGPVVDVPRFEAAALRQHAQALESIVAVRELELRYARDGFAAERGKWELEQARLNERVRSREGELTRRSKELSRRVDAEGHLETDERLHGEIAALNKRLDEQVLPMLELLQSSVYDLRAAVAKPSKPEYANVVRHIQEAVRENVPAGATILVASKGDDDLLELYGRRAWHFPREQDGAYAGYYPKSDLSAIAHLEALRAHGADHLLFPGTSLWWLDHYPRFARHLEHRYRPVLRDETCAIFELRPDLEDRGTSWKSEFDALLTDFRLSFGREPAVLDWGTGLELGQEFPEQLVFSPSATGNGLAYIDGTVDIVALARSGPKALSEAERVASAAVAVVSRQGGNGLRLKSRWKVARPELPSVSIVIPFYDAVEHTEACLRSLRETLPPGFRGEVILVDDASTDETVQRLVELAGDDDGVKVIRSKRNRGFLASANLGAGAAEGDVLVFLNNDTVLLPGWLEPLIRVLVDLPDAGAVGGRLLYPDGRLQEAGGLVFADGSAWKLGYGDPDAAAPLYSYQREVDYCSGCLLATPRSLFEELGRFDARYAPGFYEDTDYCFAVRERGLKVYYEPQSCIVHVEGATAGTDLDSGPKRYQVVNQRKFGRKWKRALSEQPERPDVMDTPTLSALAVAREGRPA